MRKHILLNSLSLTLMLSCVPTSTPVISPLAASSDPKQSQPSESQILPPPSSQNETSKNASLTPNGPPVIQTLNANPTNTTGTNGVITFTTNIIDPEGDAFDLSWHASKGTLSEEEGFQVNWQPVKDGKFVEGLAVITAIVTSKRDQQSTTAEIRIIIESDGSARLESLPLVMPSQPPLAEPTNAPTPTPSSSSEASATPSPTTSPSPTATASATAEPTTSPSMPTTTPTPPPSPDTAPNKPTGLSQSNVTATGVTLTWDAVSNADSYKIYQDGSPISIGETNTSYNVTGLSSNTAYNFEVSALNTIGESEKALMTVNTPINIPQTPSNLQASNITSSSATLNWTAVDNASSYKIYIGGYEFNSSITNSKSISLSSGRFYDAQVSATNADGESALSTNVIFQTPAVPGQVVTLLDGFYVSNPDLIKTSSNHIYWTVNYDTLQRKPLNSPSTKADDAETVIDLNSTISSYTLDSQYVYTGTYDFRIKKIPLAGGTAQTLVTAGGRPYNMQQDNDFIYWQENSTVKKVSKNGGAATTLASGVSSFTIDSQFVYWDQSDDTIKKVSKNGGAETTLSSGSPCIQGGTLTYGNGALYWYANNGSAACNYSIFKLSTSGGSPQNVYNNSEGHSIDTVTFSNNRVYFAKSSKTLSYIPASGGSRTDLATMPSNFRFTDRFPIQNGKIYMNNGGFSWVLEP